MNKAEKKISMLAWTRADYEDANEEIPEGLINDDLHTEGELMTREEIDSWITDTYKTFCVIRENDEEKFNKLYDEFVLDVHYLLELGKIDPEESLVILNKDNFIL